MGAGPRRRRGKDGRRRRRDGGGAAGWRRWEPLWRRRRRVFRCRRHLQRLFRRRQARRRRGWEEAPASPTASATRGPLEGPLAGPLGALPEEEWGSSSSTGGRGSSSSSNGSTLTTTTATEPQAQQKKSPRPLPGSCSWRSSRRWSCCSSSPSCPLLRQRAEAQEAAALTIPMRTRAHQPRSSARLPSPSASPRLPAASRSTSALPQRPLLALFPRARGRGAGSIQLSNRPSRRDCSRTVTPRGFPPLGSSGASPPRSNGRRRRGRGG